MLTTISKAMKYLLFLFNFVFVITGIALIIIGLTVKGQNDEINAIDDDYATASSLLIFVGCFVFVVSFLGCCGALKESHLMIFTFSVIMAAIFVAEIAIGAAGYALRADTAQQLTRTLTESMKKYNETDTKTFWDDIQNTLSCCGANNYTDWNDITQSLPPSCCSQNPVQMPKCSPLSADFHKTPCISAISDVVKANLSTIGFSAITVAVIQLLGVIFSCKLAYSIRNDYESV